MKEIDTMIEEYYEKFNGLPSTKPVIRNNTPCDAFELVVLEALYGRELGIDFNKMTQTEFVPIAEKYIVAPPDEGIDLVVEREDMDSVTYDFVQVKNTSLSQLEMKQAFLYMENTVSKYLNKPSHLNENLLKVLSETNFSKEDKNSCRYIVVHRGVENFFKDQDEDREKVITESELAGILNSNSIAIPKVPKETFNSDSFNNYFFYEKANDAPAILMNLRGYDLAVLAIKYTNTTIGRNILFGQNLREALGKKSSTYEDMKKTICEEPEKFWFYNNGITIIAEDFDVNDKTDNTSYDKKVESVTLKNFSIINGAQTTSALGRFLREAKMFNRQTDIEQLKKVFVLTRVLMINNSDLQSKIAIYNNSQNPITTRDMAANRDEQIKLHERLQGGENPKIYMEIRRGSSAPADLQLQKHQKTSNEELAQLAFAGFLRNPATAKDKKKSLFDTDHKQNEFLLNEFYHRIFHMGEGDSKSEGILFIKTKEDINELLFVYYLYKESKKKRNSHVQKKNQRKTESNGKSSSRI